MLESDVLAAFQRLAPLADVSASLCAAAATGAFVNPTELRTICTRAGLPHAKGGEVERALLAGTTVGVFARSSALTWRTADTVLARELAPMLLGAHLYQSTVHQDENVVDVVLTKPPAPSQMSSQLESMLAGSWGLRDTRELLPTIAESARSSFTIMTPYMDEVGATIVLNLLKRAAVPERCLILRAGADGKPPPGLAGIRQQLATDGVTVLNFRIDRPDAPGNETFHAKVVLADTTSAYVGSTNMHKWSFEYSLELGVYVRGKAASRIADIVRAVRAVSGPMPS